MSDAHRHDLLDGLIDLSETRTVTSFLAVLIIVSVLPIPWVDEALRPLFLTVFGTELVLRLAAARRKRAERHRFERIFLLIDVLALLSFLPLDRWLGASWVGSLLLLRLARLLVLLRFARELAADVYSILTRREQLQQFGLVTTGVVALSFCSAVVLQYLSVRHEYAPGGDPNSFVDRLWWSFRQIESADNLVASLEVHPLIAMLSLGLTITGVFIISFIIGIGANIVEQVVRAERRRPVGYSEHSLVIGPVDEAELLVREFVQLYERNRYLRTIRLRDVWNWLARGGPTPRRHALPRMALLGTKDELPAYLYEPIMRWVIYRQGEGSDPAALNRVAAPKAKRAILLSHAEAGRDADALTTTALASFRAVNQKAQVFVEVTDSSNRAIMHAVGGRNTFPLDMPHFLGLFFCQHLVVPGIERLFTDLMTPSGSEIYTHIFVEPEENRRIERLGTDGMLSFESMARTAYLRRGVLLIGVFLGPEPAQRTSGLVPVDNLVQWLNPLRDPPEGSAVAAFGVRAGKVPTRLLRGLIAVTDTYTPVRDYARDLIMRQGLAAPPTGSRSEKAAREALARRLPAMRLDQARLSRVLIIGYSITLSSMLQELSRFIQGIHIVLVIGERGDEALPLSQRLQALGVGFEEGAAMPGAEGRLMPLENGGSVTVFTHCGSDLSTFAVRCVNKSGPIDAAVFFSEPDGFDRDSRTAMRLLRFVRALERCEVPHGEELHLLVEFASIAKGERIRSFVDARRCGFACDDGLKLTLISTDQIKNYFMVHSAFVPGVTGLYDEILAEEKQEIVRFELGERQAAGKGEIAFSDIWNAMQERACIALGLDLDDGTVVLNPPPDTTFPVESIVAVYALTESRDYMEPSTQGAGGDAAA